MYELNPLLVFFSIFSAFLIIQSVIHALKWRKVTTEPIPVRFKNIWGAARLAVYGVNASLYALSNNYPVEPSISYEVIRLTFLQLAIFWILYDIFLPLFAGKPQLWRDPDLGDNNSPFDRLGGDWLGNLIIKAANLAVCILWIILTEPGELLPVIPNFITWIALGIISIGIIIALSVNKKIMDNRTKISLLESFSYRFGRRAAMVYIFLFAILFFPAVCLGIAWLISPANDTAMNIGGVVGAVGAFFSIELSKRIKVKNAFRSKT